MRHSVVKDAQARATANAHKINKTVYRLGRGRGRAAKEASEKQSKETARAALYILSRLLRRPSLSRADLRI